jgi:hypothetical protein
MRYTTAETVGYLRREVKSKSSEEKRKPWQNSEELEPLD